jgi:hypothetical protein
MFRIFADDLLINTPGQAQDSQSESTATLDCQPCRDSIPPLLAQEPANDHIEAMRLYSTQVYVLWLGDGGALRVMVPKMNGRLFTLNVSILPPYIQPLLTEHFKKSTLPHMLYAMVSLNTEEGDAPVFENFGTLPPMTRPKWRPMDETAID